VLAWALKKRLAHSLFYLFAALVKNTQLEALGLVTNAVVLWNTIYMQASLEHLRQQSFEIREEHETRLSSLLYWHINMLGHYSFTLTKNVMNGILRPLNQPSVMFGIP
jgi:hypothetical protein